MRTFFTWFRCRLVELMLLALYDFLKDKRSTPLFGGRMLLSLTLLSNFFFLYLLGHGVQTHPLHSETTAAAGGWVWSIGATAGGYLLIYGLTRRVQSPERIHVAPVLLRKGKWLALLYVTASFGGLFTIMWRLTPA